MASKGACINIGQQKLRHAMHERGLSSRQVAAFVGVHPVTVRRWMTGKARVPQAALMVLESRKSK